jgi:tetratricopeptide (TPR) repeat protein
MILPTLSRTLTRLILVVLLQICCASPQAWAESMKLEARELFQNGMQAARQQNWPLAVDFFLKAQKTDPNASEIWFNLGLASSKLPGYQVRAIALFKAYLLTNPRDKNAAAIRAQISVLEADFESGLAKIQSNLETILFIHKKQGMNLFLASSGWDIAGSRYYLNDTVGALRLINETNGGDWRKKWLENLNNPDHSSKEYIKFIGVEALIPAIISTGAVEEVLGLADQPFNSDAFDFLLEQGDIAHAQKFLSENDPNGWPILACMAHSRNDTAMENNALARAKTNMGVLLDTGFCQKNLWWSVGRLGFLLQMGTDGITWGFGERFHETQLVEVIQAQNLGEDHFGHATSGLASVAAVVNHIAEEYRKIRGARSGDEK